MEKIANKPIRVEQDESEIFFDVKKQNYTIVVERFPDFYAIEKHIDEHMWSIYISFSELMDLDKSVDYDYYMLHHVGEELVGELRKTFQMSEKECYSDENFIAINFRYKPILQEHLDKLLKILSKYNVIYEEKLEKMIIDNATYAIKKFKELTNKEKLIFKNMLEKE